MFVHGSLKGRYYSSNLLLASTYSRAPIIRARLLCSLALHIKIIFLKFFYRISVTVHHSAKTSRICDILTGCSFTTKDATFQKHS